MKGKTNLFNKFNNFYLIENKTKSNQLVIFSHIIINLICDVCAFQSGCVAFRHVYVWLEHVDQCAVSGISALSCPY